MQLGELIDEHFEFAFRRHGGDIAIGATVPPSSEVPRPARGRTHPGYGPITRISYSPVVRVNKTPRN